MRSRTSLPAAGAEIFALSFAVVLLEIGYTRVFSFKLYYYFTYLIIGVALLGIGTGGVLVSVSGRLRAARLVRLVPACLLLASLATLAGYLVVARTPLNAFDLTTDPREAVKLLGITLALFAPFLMAGILLAAVFGAHPDAIGRLYGADLVGAAAGCAAAVPLMSWLTPPGCVMVSALVLAVAALGRAATAPALVAPALALAAASLAAAAWPRGLPEIVLDRTKTLASADPATSPVVFSGWSPVFRVDVMRHPFIPGSLYVIDHDGTAGSVLLGFDGDVASLARFDTDPRAFPFAVLAPGARVAVIGAAGGHEVLSSLSFGARHVDAIELNPVTVSLLTRHFADYTGHLAENPRVTLVNAEGRSYLKRAGGTYDLVWLVAPDSYAAMNAATSGAFVLSESYLYTVEMVEEALAHLAAGGVLCAQFGEFRYEAKPNRTLRFLATVREALRRRGVADVASHVLVATNPEHLQLSTVLVKATPFGPDEVERFVTAARAVPASVVRHAPGRVAPAGPLAAVLTLPDTALAAWYAQHPYDVRPVTDDAPFFWHFVRFRDALTSARARGRTVDIEDYVGERVLIVLLAFAAAFAGVWLLVPSIALRGRWRAIPHRTRAGVYFGALGLGFMFFEVSLIQMLTLFLGYPTYSLSVTLFAMLFFAGLGSVAARGAAGRRTRVLLMLVTVLAGLTAFYQFGMPPIVARLGGAALPVRITVAILMVAPLGLCLGGFMPLGVRTIAALTPYQREFVAWGWAVNGFCSVIGSMLSTVVAMSAGFRLLLLGALVAYGLGVAALWGIPQADGRPGRPGRLDRRPPLA